VNNWVGDNTVTGSGSIFENAKPGLVMPKNHSQFTTVPVNSIEVSQVKAKSSEAEARLKKAKTLVKGDGASPYLGLSD